MHFAYLLLVTSTAESSRIYHVLSNLLGMLRIVFMFETIYLGFFQDAHVPMADISGYICERVVAYHLY